MKPFHRNRYKRDETLAVLQLHDGIIWRYDPAKAELRPEVTRGYGEEERRPVPPPEKPGEALPDGPW